MSEPLFTPTDLLGYAPYTPTWVVETKEEIYGRPDDDKVHPTNSKIDPVGSSEGTEGKQKNDLPVGVPDPSDADW